MDTNPNMQVAEASKAPIITPINTEVMVEQFNLDVFLVDARLNTVESVNRKLREDLYREQNKYLDDKEAFVKKIQELKTKLVDSEMELQSSNLNSEKALKKVKQDLEATKKDLELISRELETTKRDLYATSRELEEEKLLHKESRKALNEEKYKVYQNEQDIRQLHLNIAKLKETFMESVSELRGGVMPPHSMVGMYQPQFPNREYPSQMDLNYEKHRSKRKAIDDEPEFKEHPSKYKTMGGDLRETIQFKKVPKPERYKRICHNGNLCPYHQKCDYAHTIEELVVCRNGISCDAKSYCGYMIHSEEDRKQLSRFVKSRGINIFLCKEFEKYKKCSKGTNCGGIHHYSHKIH